METGDGEGAGGGGRRAAAGAAGRHLLGRHRCAYRGRPAVRTDGMPSVRPGHACAQRQAGDAHRSGGRRRARGAGIRRHVGRGQPRDGLRRRRARRHARRAGGRRDPRLRRRRDDRRGAPSRDRPGGRAAGGGARLLFDPARRLCRRGGAAGLRAAARLYPLSPHRARPARHPAPGADLRSTPGTFRR